MIIEKTEEHKSDGDAYSNWYFWYSNQNDWCEVAQSAGAVENTDLTSGESKTLLNKCPRYDNKQSDSEAPALGNTEYHSVAIAPRSTQARSGSTW